jgi:hypothetical protein
MLFHLLISALILLLIGYAIIVLFGVPANLAWIIYGTVVGVPLVVIPVIVNKPPPDLAKPLLALPYVQEIWGDDGAGSGLMGPNRVLLGRRTWGMGRNKKRT